MAPMPRVTGVPGAVIDIAVLGGLSKIELLQNSRRRIARMSCRGSAISARSISH